jgi:simple sugar transport system ATP-binding protein
VPAPLLAATDISKRFAENGIQAVSEAGLTVRSGEIHAVVGENGAGKSTLMQIIAGVVEPDAGDIRVSGAPLPAGDAGAARHAGIVMSYQHPRLDRGLTVLENLFLGEEPRRFGIFFDRRSARVAVAGAAPDFPAHLLSRSLGSLSSGQIRMVSLVAALLRLPTDRPGLLILDEPTEASTPAEVEHIFSVIRRSAAAGHGVIFISHKLPEVRRIAQTVTVLREGRTVATFSDRIDVRSMAGAMVGEAPSARASDAEAPGVATGPGPAARTDLAARFGPAHRSGHDDLGGASRAASAVLRLDHVTVRAGDRELLSDVTLEICPGEIVGVTGIRENGLETLEELLGGKVQPSDGVFEVAGRSARGLSSDRLRRLGLRYVPTDRLLRGASIESSVSDNLIALKRRELQRSGILDTEEIAEFTSTLRSSFRIEGSLHVPLWQLSGGNIQKVILSRELEGDPRLVVICEPSWGLDFRSRERIVGTIRESANEGAAVLVISTDIDEVLELADRIGVLYDGRLVAQFDHGPARRDRALRDAVGRAMAGAVNGDGNGRTRA